MLSRRFAAALLATLCLFGGVHSSALACGTRCVECCASDGDPTAVRQQMPCCRAARGVEPARPPSGVLSPEGTPVALAPARFVPPARVALVVAPLLRPTGALLHVALYRQHCSLLL